MSGVFDWYVPPKKKVTMLSKLDVPISQLVGKRVLVSQSIFTYLGVISAAEESAEKEAVITVDILEFSRKEREQSTQWKPVPKSHDSRLVIQEFSPRVEEIGNALHVQGIVDGRDVEIIIL